MSGLEGNYIIRSKRQMRAPAAPTRQEIVDVLPGMGTVSVAELATALGRPYGVKHPRYSSRLRAYQSWLNQSQQSLRRQ